MNFKFVILLSVFMFNFCAFAQFTSITQPSLNSFLFVEVNETASVDIAGGYSFIKSNDGGYTWTQYDLDTLGAPFSMYYVYKDACIISASTYCLVGYNSSHNTGVIIRTTNGGLNWSLMLETSLNDYGTFYSVTQNGNGTLIAVNLQGVYRSIDSGLTWTFTPLASIGMGSPRITYNKSTNNFISSLGTHLYTSSDEGITWNTIPAIFNTTIKSITNQTNNLLFSYTNSGSGINLVEMNNLNQAFDSVIIQPSSSMMSNALKSFFLPNGNIIVASDGDDFYNINPTTNSVLFYEHQLLDLSYGLPTSITDFDLGDSHGIAVGHDGALSRFDLSAPEQLYASANFTMSLALCPNDTLFASPDFAIGDSVKWYIDNTLISTDTNLFYILPYNFIGTHEVKFKNFYNGAFKEDSASFTMNVSPFPSYHIMISDTSVCFNSKASVFVQYTGTNQSYLFNSFVEIFFNDSLIYGPSPAGTSYLAFNTPIINGIDTLTYVVYKTGSCGINYDSTQFILTSGPDLRTSYSELPNEDSICSSTTVQFKFDSLNYSYNYQISFSNPNSPYNGYYYNFNSNGGDTVSILTNPIYYPNGANTNGYSLFNIKISDSSGCSQTVNSFDSVKVFPSPTVNIYQHSQSYYLGDTAVISNLNVALNRQWSVDDTVALFSNSTDTVPILSNNTPSFLLVSLINNSMTCTDSSGIDIRYAEKFDSIPLNLCQKFETGNGALLKEAKQDAEGNLYTLTMYRDLLWGQRPWFYSIRKYSPNGNLIWERKNPYMTFVDLYAGLSIENFDFDAEGNIYCAYWISRSNTGYTDELVNYEPIGINTTNAFIVKLDKNTGSMIWAQNIADYPILNAPDGNTNGDWKITDILVSKISNRIYFTTTSFSSGQSEIICIDMNRNFISSDYWGGNGGSSGHFIQTDNTMSGINCSCNAYLSPKLYELSTGVIVGLAYFVGTPKHKYQAIPGIQSSIKGIYAFKFTPENGLSSFKRIADFQSGTIGYSLDDYRSSVYPMAAIDKNDNLTVVASWDNNHIEHYTNIIMDSLIPMGFGTAVFQIDSSFSLNWITTGNQSFPQDLSVAKQTGEILLSGLANRCISFGNDSEQKMIGDEGITPLSPPSSIYFVHFSESGTPTNANIYEVIGVNNLERTSIQSVVSPCGDFASVINRSDISNPYSLMIQGELLSIDSSLVLRWSSDCVNTPSGCSYVSTVNESALYSCHEVGDSVSIIFPDAYLVDSIVYQLDVNGTLLSQQTQVLEQQVATVYLPYGANTVYILSPVIDTIQILPGQFSTSYNYPSYICYGDTGMITNTDTSLSFLWQDNSTANSYELSNVNYAVGDNLIIVESYNENGCSNIDSLNFFVGEPIIPTISFTDTVTCNEHLIIAYQQSNYSNVTFFVNGQVTINDFSNQNMIEGPNILQMEFTDTNGCSIDTSITLFYVACTSSLNVLKNDVGTNEFMVIPNPSNGCFELIVAEENIEYTISITDDFGRVIFQKKSLETKNIQIETNFAPGHYLLNIKGNKSNWRTQIIIQ